MRRCLSRYYGRGNPRNDQYTNKLSTLMEKFMKILFPWNEIYEIIRIVRKNIMRFHNSLWSVLLLSSVLAYSVLRFHFDSIKHCRISVEDCLMSIIVINKLILEIIDKLWLDTMICSLQIYAGNLNQLLTWFRVTVI